MSAYFQFATESDGDGILKIMEGDAVKGDINLLYTRRPDPVASFFMESGRSVIGVFKNGKEAVGTIACIPREMYINSEAHRVCYVTNMKRAHDYEGLINWIEAFEKMYDPVDSEVFFCSVVKENTDVIKMLTKKRRKLPVAVIMEPYRTYMINPSARIKNPCPKLFFRRAGGGDEREILDFLKTHGSGKNFFPVIDMLDGERNPAVSDFYMLSDGERTVAVGALWDRSLCKQYIVKSYSRKIAVLRCLNGLLSFLGYIRIPKAGSSASFAFLSFFMAENDNTDYYRTFLYHIRKEAAERYDMFVLGTTEYNKKREVLDKVRAITFDTLLCEVKMSDFKNAREIEFSCSGLEVECALL
ncbi:MAG: hypothetical protein K5770_19680 [Lachnospiraceae bacterium]|nr:hypothetical protein [Lachnospiraceae bacterium]